MSFLYSPSPSFQTVYSVENWGNTTTRKEAKRRRSTKLFFDWLRRESHHLLHLLVVFFLCLFFVDVDVDVVPLYSIQLFPCFCSSSSKFRCVATTRESISFQSKKENFFSFSLLLPPLSTDWKKKHTTTTTQHTQLLLLCSWSVDKCFTSELLQKQSVPFVDDWGSFRDSLNRHRRHRDNIFSKSSWLRSWVNERTNERKKGQKGGIVFHLLPNFSISKLFNIFWEAIKNSREIKINMRRGRGGRGIKRR